MNRITDTLRDVDHDITLDERHQAADRITALETALRDIRDDRWIPGRGVSQGSHYDHVQDVASQALRANR